MTPAAQLLARAVEASADAVWCQDRAGTVLTWNAAAERLYGYCSDEIVGRCADVLAPATAAEELRAATARALDGDRLERFDTAQRRRDGSCVVVSLSVVPLRGPGDRVEAVATTATDVTVRIELAQELDRAREELQRQNTAMARSNRDLEQFAYVASHDLSEPLRVMTGYVDALERRYADVLDERGRRYMHHIVDASTRMRSLIDDLLEYSRFLRAPRCSEAVSTEQVVARVLESLEPRLRETGATIDVGPLPRVWFDDAQLHSLLQNLLGNAIKFSSPGTVPRIAVSGAVDAAEEWVTLVVDDNGIGIEPEYRERVFGMFQRLHVRELYSGTGIGLAIAQQVVELHGGRIWVEDSPLGGARLCCTLPAVPADAPGGTR